MRFAPVRRILQRLELLRRRTAQAIPPVALPSGPAPAGDSLPCLIASNTYGTYCVPQSSVGRPATQEILHGRVWEPETIDFICQHARDGDIIHAGAYFGDFLPALARATRGTVWAFEPNRENFRCAEITTRLNGLDNVRLMSSGLSDKPGVAPMLVRSPDGSGMGGASRLVASPTELTEPVDLTTIDDVLPVSADVNVLQLDVEGHEGEALKGGLRTIERCRPAIVLETTPRGSWFFEMLTRLGYFPAKTVNGNAVFISG